MLSSRSLLGRYTIRQHLGAGGMGDVYVAHDPTLDRLVAVKVLADQLASDGDRLSRFVREARAASALNHPSILTVFDFGEHDGMHYLVTELVDGRTLREWSAEQRPPLGEVLEVIAQVAAAVGAAHAAGIVHRDVKPENLMLRADGFVKVLDFGIAKLLAEPASSSDTAGHTDPNRATMPGTILGTTRYMSPEQALGTAVDARSDVWSLGVVLYELLAGKPPFEGPTPMGTLAMIMGREPEPLDVAAPGTPETVCSIVARTLRKRPDERFASAGELAAALRQVQHELETGATQERTGETKRLPATSAPAAPVPTNLPASTSPIVGRKRDLEEVTALLCTEGVRLVTLTGPGGTGKTRLAIEVARGLAPEFGDGVFAVGLGALSDPALVAAEVAHTLGVREVADSPMSAQLAQYLADREILLLLDSFEHLLEAAPLVAELLSAAPGLRVLVTSRAPLHLSHERDYAVDPLEVPMFSSLPPLDELARNGAVALFVERARDAKPSFALTAGNARAVVDICRRLDGLPLAIELAAARVKLFAPGALLGRLEHGLKLLTGGARDLPARQQTMRGAVQWSYDLLEPRERELLCRLAVFAGGCDFEAAEAVCGPAGLDVLDGIGSLVDKSLLRQREQADGESRFLMLDLVREFALEQLEAGGWTDEARGAHARYFLELAKIEPELSGVDVGEWLARLARDHDNFRAAMAYLLEGHHDESVLLAAALSPYWTDRCHYMEGNDWTERALAKQTEPSPALARLLRWSGVYRWRLSDYDGAKGQIKKALPMALALGERRTAALSLNTLGTVANTERRLPEAKAYFEEGLAIARELGDATVTGILLTNLGEVARAENNYDAAARYYAEALEVEGRDRLSVGVAITLLNLGATRFEQGDIAEARACFLDGLARAARLGNPLSCALGLEGLAAVAVEAGHAERAAALAGAAESERESSEIELDDVDTAYRSRYVGKLKAALEPGALEAAWARGRAMGLEAAIAEALRVD